ncbi:MAG: mycofactocin-coupled SDR family oxidoreductase [Actinomycetia bacterium]|nr:mycofactocin-coupled SDR family oxidoreductase [Actinomycetes bacterium]
MGSLQGKVALITGGARGQGRAIAARLARDGADIVIADISRDIPDLEYSLASDADALETTRLVESAGQRCLSVRTDVRDQAALDRAVAEGIEAFGSIDVLVSNAGIVDYKPLWEITEEDWSTMLDVNLTGGWRALKAVAGNFRERLSGAIVFNSSINGVEAGWNYAHYVSAKHGLLGLMKAAALELAPYGVRSNAVLPTVMDAPNNLHAASFDRVAGKRGATREEWFEATRSWHALRGRGALPTTAVADAVAWLASDNAHHITGVAIPVDAGHTILPGVNPVPIGGEGPEHETLDPWPACLPGEIA